MRWLRSLRFDDLGSRATFVDYPSGVEMLVARRAALIAALEQVIPDSRHAPAIAALRCFRGIDTLSAAGLCAEIGDWQRFRPKQLSGFLGIVPTEHTSDTKRRQGSITKSGSVHARRLLVEASHHYRHRHGVGDNLARRQHGQDRRVIENHLACTAPPAPALADSRRPAPQARRHRRDRLSARARRVLLGGRTLTQTPPDTRPRDRCCRSALETTGPRLVATSSPRNGYEQPPTTRSLAAPPSRPRTATNTGS
jgi:hypothetical protein